MPKRPRDTDAVRGKKVAPPVDPKWPWRMFRKRMTPLDFIGVMTTNDACTDITRKEMIHEFKQATLPKIKQPEHFGRNTVWSGWSALKQLEYSIDKVGDCTNFLDCLISEFVYWVDSRDRHNEGEVSILHFVRQLKILTDKLFDKQVYDYKPNIDIQLVDKTLKPAIHETRWHNDAMVNKRHSMAPWNLILRLIPPKALGKKMRQEKSQQTMTHRLVLPTLIPEVDLKKAIKELFYMMMGGSEIDDDGNIQFPSKLGDIKITTNRQCAAALVLCQAAVGSRALGIIALNTFEPVDFSLIENRSKTSDEQVVDIGERVTDLKRAYSSTYTSLITVRRISKSQTKEARAYNKYLEEHPDDDPTKFLTEEQLMDAEVGAEVAKAMERIDSDEIQKIQDELVGKVITKPLIAEFLMPELLFIDQPYGNLLEMYTVPDITPAMVFMDIIDKARKFLSRGSRLRFTPLPNPESPVALAPESIYTKERITLSQRWIARMNDVIKDVFSAMKFNGSHQMRRLYVAYGYELYAKYTMKEIGWTKRVLAHESHAVSLVYTTLKIIPGVGANEREPMDAMQAQLDEIKELLIQQGKRLSKVEMKDYPAEVSFFDRVGNVVTMGKLPRARRGDDHEERTQRIFELLEEADVKPTRYNFIALGGNKKFYKKQ